jgi:hypothetical protein
MTSHVQFERGQAMTEFVVAMLIVVPLVLGVIYIGKYEDLKFSAIQASRHAAFDRVFDPLARHKNSTVLAEETRARFFTDPMLKNQGAVAFQDSTQGQQGTKGTLNQNWYGTGGDPVVQRYSEIRVDVRSDPNAALVRNWYKTLDAAGKVNFSIADPGIAEARVQVPLAKVVTFAPLAKLNLNLDVSTAVLTDGFNAGGATSPSVNNVHDRTFADWGLIFGKIPNFQSLLSFIDKGVLKYGWQALSDTDGPQWGCVSPDVVPGDVAPGAKYDPKTNC